VSQIQVGGGDTLQDNAPLATKSPVRPGCGLVFKRGLAVLENGISAIKKRSMTTPAASVKKRAQPPGRVQPLVHGFQTEEERMLAANAEELFPGYTRKTKEVYTIFFSWKKSTSNWIWGKKWYST
jgi:hypothetical protein